MPKYEELSVSKLWSYAKNCDDLAAYFPDLDENKLPERNFMIGILSTLRNKEMRELIKESRKNRSVSNNPDQNELIEMTPLTRDEIMGVFPQKSKLMWIIIPTFIATSGRSHFLLKKGAKLHRNKGVRKKYKADLDKLFKKKDGNNEEEEKEEMMS